MEKRIGFVVALVLLALALVVGCAPNFFNKAASERTATEKIGAIAANTAIRIGARNLCATRDVGERRDMVLLLGPARQYAVDKDFAGLMQWFADGGLGHADEQLRTDLYPIVQESLNMIEPCQVAPDSLECKNFWTSMYGEGLVSVIDGCYGGAIKAGGLGGGAA